MMYKPDFSHKLIQADATSKCNGFFAKFGKKLTYRSIFLHKHQQKNDTAVPFLFFLMSARTATAMVAATATTAGIATAATRRTIASRGYNRRERGRSERCGRCECAAVGQIVEIERI